MSGLAIGVGILCSLYLVGESLFFERTAKFSEGLETCFGRLRQSHLRLLSGDKGMSGERAFFQETESCFSEVVAYMEQHLPTSLVQGLAPLNNLVIDVHWFHKNLGRLDKFRDLEGARQGIVERLQEERGQRTERVEVVRMVLVISWGVAIALLALHWLMRRPVVETKPSAREVAQEDSPLGQPPQQAGSIPLGESVGRVLVSLADDIFSRGIHVELDIGDDVRIFSEDKSFRKALQAILLGVLYSLEEGGRLRISQRRWGPRVGLCLGPLGGDGLHHRKGETIFKLMDACKGKIEDSPQDWMGLSFVGGMTGRRRVFKGKKKDILRQLA